MSGMPNRVFDEALSLPVDERLTLIEELLHSLNLPLQPDIELAWQEEADRRVKQIEQGAIDSVAIDDVLAVIGIIHGQGSALENAELFSS